MSKAMLSAKSVFIALLLWTPFLEARRLNKSDRGRIGQRSRRLEEICDDSTEASFLVGALEKFGDISSFLGYPTQITVSGQKAVLYVDISTLSVSLREVSFLEAGLGGFKQDKEYFGHSSEYTEEIMSQHELLKHFWKVEDEQILVIGLHSEPLQGNLELAIRNQAADAIEQYNIGDESVSSSAGQIKQVIEGYLPGDYSNPLLSYEAFFIDLYDVEGFGNSTLIALGDGLIDFGESLGLGEVSSDLVHAHEFGHALQFYLDLEDFGGNIDAFYEFEENKDANDSRLDELEADAMAAYFLAHEQGRNFEVNFLLEVSQIGYSIGDCTTEEPDHHGTPKQRECAMLWGADEGLDMFGDPIGAREFRSLFRKNLDLILALDASVCHVSDDTLSGSPKSIP